MWYTKRWRAMMFVPIKLKIIYKWRGWEGGGGGIYTRSFVNLNTMKSTTLFIAPNTISTYFQMRSATHCQFSICCQVTATFWLSAKSSPFSQSDKLTKEIQSEKGARLEVTEVVWVESRRHKQKDCVSFRLCMPNLHHKLSDRCNFNFDFRMIDLTWQVMGDILQQTALSNQTPFHDQYINTYVDTEEQIHWSGCSPGKL